MILTIICFIILIVILLRRESRRDELIENTKIEQAACELSYRNGKIIWIVIGLVLLITGIVMFIKCDTGILIQYEGNARPERTEISWNGFLAWTSLVIGSALFLLSLNSFCSHDIKRYKYFFMSDDEYEEVRTKAIIERQKEAEEAENAYKMQRNMIRARNFGNFLGGL